MKKIENPKNIIVRMPNWIGDLVMATPVLTDLRKQFPQASITAMCRSPLGELLKEDRDIDELYSFSRLENRFLRRKKRRSVIQKLREGHYDLGILLTNSFSSAWTFWQGEIEKRVGYKGSARSFFLTHPVKRPKEEIHQVLWYKKLLTPLGMEPSQTLPRLYLTDKEKEEADTSLKQLGYEKGMRVIGINPGAAYGSAKCWPEERFTQLAKEIVKRDPKALLLFFGDTEGAPLVEKICSTLSERVVNLAGVTTLRQLCSFIEKCDLLITNDSGPMHIAEALKIQLIALFGSTSAKKTGPHKGVVIQKEVSCAPCYRRVCPIDFPCMKNITVDEVVEKVFSLLRVE